MKNTFKEISFAFVFYLLIVSGVFYKIVQDPKQFLVTNGDGMKNYFTFMYHIKHDTSYMTFEGMNYPFGENIVFTDNQPIIANFIKILTKAFPSLTCHLPAIHNLILLFGLVVGGIGIFLCLRKLSVGFYFSLICGAGLMLLNPQMNRLSAHFSMFYPIMPWLFLFWLHIFTKQKSLLYSLSIGVIIAISGLIHMYFFITGGIMCLVAMAVYMFLNKSQVRWFDLIKMVSLQVILPFAILTFFSSYFNHASDRPSEPWGFFSYCSTWEGLMFSYKLPLFEFVNNNITKVRGLDGEGRNYIGIFGVFTVFYVLTQLITNFKNFKTNFLYTKLNVFLLLIFLLTALISFGYPFTIKGLEWLYDYTGPFKQFRSIGRVGWVSFYAINLVSIPLIYNMLKKSNQFKVLYYFLPLLVFAEGISFAKKVDLYQSPINDYYCTDESKIPVDFSQFQASVPDPLFHIGSECFSWWDQAENINQAFKLGFKYHLPTMGVNMSRTSFEQSKLLNELVILPYKVPKIVQILKDKSSKPLLVVESKLHINDSRPKLLHWTKNAPIVFENEQLKLKSLALDSFQTISKRFNDSLAAITASSPKFEENLVFTKLQGSTGWGYETAINNKSIAPGDYTIQYWMECLDPAYVLSTTEIWQFDQNHNTLDYVGEGNRFNYKKIEGNEFFFEAKVNIKPATKKVVFKISKFNQKENQQLNIKGAKFSSNF